MRRAAQKPLETGSTTGSRSRKLYNEHMGRVLRARRTSTFWYIFGSLAMLVLGDPDRHRHLPGDALQARMRAWHSPSGRITSCAERAGRLDHPLHALDGRARRVLHRRVTCTCFSAACCYGQLPQGLASWCGCSVCGIFLCLMAEGVHGLSGCPGGQMSYIGARAGDRENLFAAVPFIGP